MLDNYRQTSQVNFPASLYSDSQSQGIQVTRFDSGEVIKVFKIPLIGYFLARLIWLPDGSVGS